VEIPYLISQLEILRRIAERGRTMALRERPPHSTYEQLVDLFQQMLNEIERTKKLVEYSTDYGLNDPNLSNVV